MKRLKPLLIASLIVPFSLLPLRVLQFIGKWFGLLALKTNKKRLYITQRNLEVCFPELSDLERDKLTRKVAEESGKWFFESGYVWYRKPDKLRDKVSVKNPELLEAAYNKNKGVIIILPHLGNFEFINYYLPFNYPFGSMYRPFKDSDFVEDMIFKGRSRVGTTMFATNTSGVRGAYKHLKEGKVLAVLSDHLPIKNAGVFAPFFGIPAHTGKLAHALAKFNHSEALLAAVIRLPRGRGFEITFSNIKGMDCDDVVESTTTMNKAIEDAVRQAPEQYQWVYRRFSRQPDGAEKVYKKL